MFFVLVALGSLLVALVRGRTLESIVGDHAGGLRLGGLAVGGVALHLIVTLPIAFSGPGQVLNWRPSGASLTIGAILYLASFVFLIAFLAANVRQAGFPIFLLGLSLNFIEIALNRGQMPGDAHQLVAAGLLAGMQQRLATGQWSTFTLIGPTTVLPWLADWIFCPLPFRAPVILSIGDITIGVGCFLFFNDPFRRSTRFSIPR